MNKVTITVIIAAASLGIRAMDKAGTHTIAYIQQTRFQILSPSLIHRRISFWGK
jgi:hypothetical protein